MNPQTKGLILTTIGVFAIIPDSLIVRLVDVSGMTFIFLRSSMACCAIVLFLFVTNGTKTPHIIRSLGRAGLLYACFFAVATFCFIFALRLTSVANALFIISTSPVFAALSSRLFLGERFSTRMIWTTFFALVGIAIIALGSHEGGQASLLGDFIALCAAASLAFSFTTARAHRHISMVPAAAIGYFLTSIICVWFTDFSTMTGRDWAYLSLLGGMFVPLGTSLMAIGPRYITSAEVALLLLLEAVIAPILVWYVVGENPGSYALIGGAIVICTLFVSNMINLLRSQPAAG